MKFARDFFFFFFHLLCFGYLGSEAFFFAGEFRLEMGVAQFTPLSFPLISSRGKKGMAGMKMGEIFDDFC